MVIDGLRIALGLVAPILLGGLWLHLMLPRKLVARPFLVWGNGTLLGMLVLPLLMRLSDALGFGLSLPVTLGLIAVLSVPAVVGLARRPAAAVGPASNGPSPWSTLSRAERALCLLLIALLVGRFGTLALEVWWRPVFPWDAIMHWSTKARVWFEHRSIEPFVDRATWLAEFDPAAYTDRHPEYPPTIPLLQVWMNLAIGHWDESRMNLPWLVCFAALGALFYGQLRLAGVSLTLSVIFTYLLLSMPLIDTHVALAGYADLFIGATFCAALMALHNWSQHRAGWLAWLALVMALLCPSIKNEGLVWSATLLPAVAVFYLDRREVAKLLVLIALILLLLGLVLPDDMVIAGHTVAEMVPKFNTAASGELVRSIWLHANWHLFGYLLLVLLPLGVLMRGALTRRFLAPAVAVAGCLSAMLFLFLFTGFGAGASFFASVGRLSVHLAPALMFLCALLWQELLRRGGLRAPVVAD